MKVLRLQFSKKWWSNPSMDYSATVAHTTPGTLPEVFYWEGHQFWALLSFSEKCFQWKACGGGHILTLHLRQNFGPLFRCISPRTFLTFNKNNCTLNLGGRIKFKGNRAHSGSPLATCRNETYSWHYMFDFLYIRRGHDERCVGTPESF